MQVEIIEMFLRLIYPLYVVPMGFGILAYILGHLAERFEIKKVGDLVATVGLLVTFYYSLSLLNRLLKDPTPIVIIYFENPPLGSCLEIDMFSALISTLASGLGFAVALYSIKYMEHDTRLPRYYALLCFLVAAIIGVAFAGDLLTLFIFYEMTGVTAYVLVAFRKDEPEPIEAAIKYLVMGAVGSIIVLYAMSLIYGLTGTLNIAYVSKYFSESTTAYPFAYLILALLIGGFGVKAAIVPMHSWLIDAHPSAPSGISAMLSGIVIKVGIYAMIRTVYLFFPLTLFDWTWLLATIGIITVFIANIIALVQKDLKRLLAYSSIYNVGLIILAFSLGSLSGASAGMFHIMNHAVMKGLAFLCAGAIVHTIHTRNLDEMRGIGRKMPVTGIFFAIALLGLAGVPPTVGFLSKFLIIYSAVQLNNTFGTIIAWIVLLNSVLAVAYYARVIKIIWMDRESENIKDVKEVSPIMWLSMFFLVVLIIVAGIYPAPFFEIAVSAAKGLIDKTSYVNAIMNL
ncbi:MAG: complex I subunit 5 family protein [Candidatus Asgardarchaeia archaeon]